MNTFQENEVTEAWEEILSNDKYRKVIQEIADSYPDKRSVFVEFADIDSYNTDMAMFILEEPDFCINLGLKTIQAMMPSTWDPKNRIALRITSLPRDSKVDIRKLRESHLGKLVAIDGMTKKVSSVKPRMTYARFTCARCGAEIWEPQSGMFIREPLMCPNPNGTCNKQINRFILDNTKCHFIDTQKIEIQENTESLRGGVQPQRISGYVEDDLAGILSPGNRITLNGIIRPVEKQERDKSTLFDIFIDIISIEFEQHEYDEIKITEEDEEKILSVSKDPQLFEHIVSSIAPTIYGMKEVKQAIALQLFGGCHKVNRDGSQSRGDTHILLVGDPGVAKSQILRFMGGLAPRGIFASGKSASAAGLTAAVVKDDFGGEGFTLEAGALVLADGGLACIDELDKMTDQDRSSLHEAMESQKISIAKAGINATLQCRCSLLAAANPKLGRFNTEVSIAEQIDLPPALMSRFDLIFVLTDKPDEQVDRNITRFILDVHRRGEALQVINRQEEYSGVDIQGIVDRTGNLDPYFDRDFLRKYVAYSKRFVPVMTDKARDLIENSYMAIRMSGSENHSIPITARQLEAYVRLSEASAKMRLSRLVEEQDAKRAIKLVEYYLNKIAHGDVDTFMSSFTAPQRSKMQILSGIANSLEQPFSMDTLLEAAEAEGLEEADTKAWIQKMVNDGIYYSPSSNQYKKV